MLKWPKIAKTWKKSRSSEIKNRYIVFFKGSTNMNELKKKVVGGPSKNTKKVFFFLVGHAAKI